MLMPIGRIVFILIGIFLAVLFGAVYPLYRRDIRRARERVSTGSRIAETPCGPIEYAVAGEGLPVLVVHGAGGGFDQGLDISMPLVQNGFRLIAVSRFGYLRTPLPEDASAASQADAHASLLDALNVPRAAVLGASAGAPSSMQFALRHPDRVAALVLLVPAAYVPRAGGAPSIRTPPRAAFLFDTALRSDFLFWAAPRLAPRWMLRGILATPSSVVENATEDERRRVALMLEHILPVSRRRLGLRNDVSVVSSLPRYNLERIAAPTLILSVADDLYGTFDAARYSDDHIPHARLIGYSSGGHLLVGHQGEAMSEIVAFLRGAGK
jgi:2-hydroxy-6-oxonona-2,4-dienedioate hydrolase